jgi:hypothetical protein
MTRFLIIASIYWASAMHGVDPRIVTAQEMMGMSEGESA